MNSVSLNVNNYFNYALDPCSQELTLASRVAAFAITFFATIFTAGLFLLAMSLYQIDTTSGTKATIHAQENPSTRNNQSVDLSQHLPPAELRKSPLNLPIKLPVLGSDFGSGSATTSAPVGTLGRAAPTTLPPTSPKATTHTQAKPSDTIISGLTGFDMRKVRYQKVWVHNNQPVDPSRTFSYADTIISRFDPRTTFIPIPGSDLDSGSTGTSAPAGTLGRVSPTPHSPKAITSNPTGPTVVTVHGGANPLASALATAVGMSIANAAAHTSASSSPAPAVPASSNVPPPSTPPTRPVAAISSSSSAAAAAAAAVASAPAPATDTDLPKITIKFVNSEKASIFLQKGETVDDLCARVFNSKDHLPSTKGFYLTMQGEKVTQIDPDGTITTASGKTGNCSDVVLHTVFIRN